MSDILSNLTEMTGFGIMGWETVLMWLIAFVLLYQIGRAHV